MRKLENFVKIVALTVMMIAVLLVSDMLILGYIALKTDAGLSNLAPSFISGQINREVNEQGEVQYDMSQQGMDRIDSFGGFAFLLDDSGNVVWSYQLPHDVPRHYTVREIVQFTRFYLSDYPVYTRIVDDMVLVIGMPKQTVWKYNLSFPISMMDMLIPVLPFLFFTNVAALLAGSFLIIKHDSHKREMQRTSWIAGVSHDIRTPLSLVLGYADELLDSDENGADTESIAEKAQMIEQQAIRIKTLVTNLNTSNKLTYGMGVWHKERVLLPALIRESVCEIINRNPNEKYDVCVNILESLEQLCVNGDRDLIKRLIENLVYNAINHNPQGCEIRISLTQQSGWIFKKLILEISDNGCGVSNEQLKYFRTSIKSDKLPEHGLGIRLVRQIASFHHWRVRFFNNKDGGLCCRVLL